MRSCLILSTSSFLALFLVLLLDFLELELDLFFTYKFLALINPFNFLTSWFSTPIFIKLLICCII